MGSLSLVGLADIDWRIKQRQLEAAAVAAAVAAQSESAVGSVGWGGREVERVEAGEGREGDLPPDSVHVLHAHIKGIGGIEADSAE